MPKAAQPPETLPETLEDKQRRWARAHSRRIGAPVASEPLGQKPQSMPLSAPLPPSDLRK